MLSERQLNKLIQSLQEQQKEIASRAMLFPSSEILIVGTQAGKYQGIQVALDTIDSILRDQLDEESRS